MSEPKIQEEIPDFDFDLAGVDTSRPVPVAQVYLAEITGISREPNKDKKGFNLNVEITLQGDVVSEADANGDTKAMQDVKLTTAFPLQAKPGGKDPEWFKKNLATFVDAVLGTTIADRPNKPDWNAMRGQTVMVETTNDTDPKFGRRATVSRWMHNAS